MINDELKVINDWDLKNVKKNENFFSIVKNRGIKQSIEGTDYYYLINENLMWEWTKKKLKKGYIKRLL